MEASGYRPAAICRRGHVASTDIQLSPELASTKCGTCGAKILPACPECNNSIRGRYYVPGVLGVGYEYSPPVQGHSGGSLGVLGRTGVD